MSSFVDSWKFHPVIDFGVVEFDSVCGTTYFFSWTWDQNISVSNSAARVTMSSVLHSLLVDKFQVVVDGWLITDQFLAQKHAVWESFVVTTTEHKDTWLLDANLDHLEIMWKVPSELDIFMVQSLIPGVEYGDWFWIFLKDKELLWKLGVSCLQISTKTLRVIGSCEFWSKSLSSILLGLITTRNCFNITNLMYDITRFFWCLSSFCLDLHSTLTSFNVLKHLLIHELFTATWTHHSKQFDHISDSFVHFTRLTSIVAHQAFPSFLWLNTMPAVQNTTVLILALHSIVYDTITDSAHKKIIYWMQTRWSIHWFIQLQSLNFRLHFNFSIILSLKLIIRIFVKK